MIAKISHTASLYGSMLYNHKKVNEGTARIISANRIVLDMTNTKVAAETKAYKPIPIITPFLDEQGNDIMQEQIQRNYNRIKSDVLQTIESEKERFKNDPNLKRGGFVKNLFVESNISPIFVVSSFNNTMIYGKG